MLHRSSAVVLTLLLAACSGSGGRTALNAGASDVESDRDEEALDEHPHECAVLASDLLKKSGLLGFNYGLLVERHAQFDLERAERGLPPVVTRQDQLDAHVMAAGGMNGMASPRSIPEGDGGIPDSEALRTDVSEYRDLPSLQVAELSVHRKLQSIKSDVEECLSQSPADMRVWAKLSIATAFDAAGWSELGDSIGEGNLEVLQRTAPFPIDRAYSTAIDRRETEPERAIEYFAERVLAIGKRPETDVAAREQMAVLQHYIAEAYANLGDGDNAENHLTEAALLMTRAARIDPRVPQILRRMYFAAGYWSEIEVMREQAVSTQFGTWAHRYKTITEARETTRRASVLLGSNEADAISVHKSAVRPLWELLRHDPEDRTLRSEWTDRSADFFDDLQSIDPESASRLRRDAVSEARAMAYSDPTWQVYADILNIPGGSLFRRGLRTCLSCPKHWFSR